MTNPDALTVLHSPYLRLAKRLRHDGQDGYDKAKTLDAYTAPIGGLDDLLALLRRLILRPSCCVIRGQLLEGVAAKGVRRLLHMDRETGELPTFADVSRRWLALDLDGLPMPEGIEATDLTACGIAALASLPEQFRGTACIIQASASHGVKPGLRLRIWVWLSRPMWGHEAKRWLKAYPCDPSVFGAVQPIYTAAPVLASGVLDPIPERLLALPGKPSVEVPSPESLAPPPPPKASAASIREGIAHRYVRAALERAATNIASAREGNRHPLIVAEACRLARFVGPGWLASSDLASVVRAAAKQAGKDDEGELDAAIAYGLANPWTAGPMPGDARNG